MKAPAVLLLLVIPLLFPKPGLADSVGASGYYIASGNVTIIGAISGPCGSSPCVESLNFSFLLLVTSLGPDPGGTLLYSDTIVGGPGIYSASGPLGWPWSTEIIPGFSSVDVGFVFDSNSMPDAVIDAVGFNAPYGIPHAISGPLAYFYACYNDINAYFGCQYGLDTGSETITVQQIPEPSSHLLIAITGLGILASVLVKKQFAIRRNY